MLTVTDTAPVPGGETAVMRLSDTTLKEAAGVPPKKTPVAFINPAPLILTVVPPVVGPWVGLLEVMTGGGWKPKLNELSEPPGVMTVIGTVPTACAGMMRSTSVSPTTPVIIAGVDPKRTLVVPAKPVPVIAAGVPPDITPAVGKIAVGAGSAI